MAHLAKKTISAVVLIGVLLISSYAFAQPQSIEGQTPRTKENAATYVPDLSEIIPEAAKLSGELAFLEDRIKDVLDVSELEKEYAGIEKNLNFGLSSLDFELRVWVLNAEERLTVISELHQEIDRKFREAKIEIAFPQQDLHLRSVDESILFKPTESAR